MATPPLFLCVYPLSPTYLPTHRYLYYNALAISVLYPRPPPFVKGAFAFALTYSSTAAIYAILIIAIRSPNVLNLDMFGLWAVLSPASIAILPLLQYSKSVSGGGRPILRTWGVLIIAASICAFVFLVRLKGIAGYHDGYEQTCISNPPGLKYRLRIPEITASVSYEDVFGYYYDLIVARGAPLTLVPMIFGTITCLVTISPVRERAPWDLEVNLNPYAEEAPSRNIPRALKIGFHHLRAAVLYLSPMFLIPTVVINELYLMRDKEKEIPEMEKVYEIGQWGLLLGAGLVAVAALIGEVAGKPMKRVDEAQI